MDRETRKRSGELTKQDITLEIELSEEDRRFIKWCREFGWGKIELLIKAGKPVMSSVVRRDYRFDVDG